MLIVFFLAASAAAQTVDDITARVDAIRVARLHFTRQ
jgi:hypothetical protein